MADETPEEPIVVFVGIPANMKAFLGARLSGVKPKYIALTVKPPYDFEQKTDIVANTLNQLIDANHDKCFCLIVLPYKTAALQPAVLEALALAEEFGVVIQRPIAGTNGWPSRPPQFDERFHKELLPALKAEIEAAFHVPREPTIQEKAAFDIIRGLIAKNKMGKGNNHSHWDDMWSSRGQDLGPGDRDSIVGDLARSGILGSKRNDSAGGKGMVFWVIDVDKALARFPDLAPLLGRDKK